MRHAALVGALLLCVASTALAEEVELVSGEVLQAEVFERTAEFVVIDHPLLGRIAVPAQNIANVRPGKLDRAVQDAAGGAAGAAPDAAAATPAGPAPEWNWSVEVGASGTTGNTETTDLHMATKGLYEDDDKRWSAGASYNYGKTEGDRTKENVHAAVQRDWKLVDSKWYPFAGVLYDWDEFQDWDYRLSIEAGAGYQYFKNERHDLKFRIGAAGTREFGGRDDSWRPEGLLGVDWGWKISKSQKIGLKVTVYPDLEDRGEYRGIADLAWTMKMDTLENMSLKIGLHDEYDTHREDPFERNEFQWFVALLFDF